MSTAHAAPTVDHRTRMTSYQDNLGRTWLVRFDVGALRRVRAVAGLDLLAGRAAAVEALVADPVAMADVLYAVCLPQADVRGVDRESFGRALMGRPFERASEAAFDALAASLPVEADFASLPTAPQRPADKRTAEPPRDPWEAVHEYAAAAGVEPDRFTYRELVWAWRTRAQTEWDRTTFAVAAALNATPGRKGKPLRPVEIHPFRIAIVARPSGTMTGAEMGRLLVAAYRGSKTH